MTPVTAALAPSCNGHHGATKESSSRSSIRVGKYTEAIMLQHMRSHPGLSACPRIPDLYGYKALIYLGYVASSERFDLAIRAVNKTRRFSSGEIQLIVAINDGRIERGLDIQAHCSFHAPEGLQGILDDYRRAGSLLIPDQNESVGDAILHALASGVPLDALNFCARPGYQVRSRHGDAFLAVGRTRDRSN